MFKILVHGQAILASGSTQPRVHNSIIATVQNWVKIQIHWHFHRGFFSDVKEEKILNISS